MSSTSSSLKQSPSSPQPNDGKRPNHRGVRPPYRPKPPKLMEQQDLFAKVSSNPLSEAFPKKAVVHPFVDARPVPKDNWSSIWQDMSHQDRQSKSVAYLHIPFCENHCLFCGFYQNPWRSNQSEVYADTIIEEIRASKDLPSHTGHPLHAVYFGGGTPTALDTPDLCRIIEAVRTYLPLAPDCEITIEGRIFSFPLEKAKACFDAGANRISLGVQTFDSKLRRRVGRKVSGEQARDFLSELVALDQGAVVIDLIYGFPEQSLDSWRQDVTIASELGLDGVDLYSLSLLPSSPLAIAIDKGKFSTPPRHDELGQYYQIGQDVLAQKGWMDISTTHWRSSTRERNLYNLLVKTGANCLAFGSGAGGFLSDYSFRVDGDLKRYIKTVLAGKKPLGFLMKMPSDRAFFNEAKGQMETGRLHIVGLLEALHQRGLDGESLLLPVLHQWQESGLLNVDQGWAKLTLAGRFWQVTMTHHLIQWIQQHLPAANQIKN
ncbi:heme anaerobic degradation radical SAM methyltransferase ChuW/HutW [Cohaesibacter gelatinilyticus]|uniref:Coproporphyrinogen III oxidase, anaerobic n=1 Tax=Cohaesibacter gelatinilyticus TaxID=372072 RepID=A0A285PH47_9HYPH|nr:heme anaerobic degradation radical SAM methyltransferase ChuW/HutW [Cohaesibacter gelatinilyticus]SNZ20603.1 coproporphyrinogen III oxidase, anaerobic [Cohaesibacter gelatinilyticus]